MTGRALLTPTEREVLAGLRRSEEYRSTVRSRLRNRLEDLRADVRVLETEEPDLLAEIQTVLC